MPSPFLKAKAPKISRIFEKDMVKAQKNNGKDVKAKAKAKDNLSLTKKPKPIVKSKSIKTAKDDSSPEVLKVQHENLRKNINKDIASAIKKSKLQQRPKDDSGYKKCNITLNINGAKKRIKYYGKADQNSLINYVRDNIWIKGNLKKRFGNFENFKVKILKKGG